MYINKISKAGDYVLVSNYTPRFFGSPGKKRREKMRDTPKAMAKYNNHKRAEKLQLLMLLNFDKGYHITLDYPKDNRPQTYEEAEKILTKFLHKMSRRLKNKEKKFKYIAITERGKKREALHHHMVIEGDPLLLRDLTDLWGNHIKISQMYEDGGYKELAEYFCKIETKEEQTKGKSKYHRSRNLKEPTTKSRIVAGHLENDPYIPDGYELMIDTLVNGFNDFAGIRYQRYMIKRTDKSKQSKGDQKGRKKISVWESLKSIFRKRERHG